MADDLNRAFGLTFEVFPSLAFFCPQKLAWDVEAIRDEHESKIRATVLEILQNTCSSEAPAESAVSLFNSVLDLGTELLSAALDRAAWIDDDNPSEVYDETADALYQDALDFAKKKYQSVASEIPGLGFEIRPDLLVVMRTTWLRIREEAKRDVHGWSKQIREQNARLDQEAGRATQSASPPTAAGSDRPAPAKENARTTAYDDKATDKSESASAAQGDRTDCPIPVRGTAKGTMGEDHFLKFVDPDYLRQMGERFPGLTSAIAGAAAFIRAMDEAKAKAEIAFIERGAAEKWGTWDLDRLKEKRSDILNGGGPMQPWRSAGVWYVWELASTYLRSPFGDCTPDMFESVAKFIIDVYSEKVYEEKLKPYEQIWLPNSRDDFQKYVRKVLDPSVRGECLDRWQKRIAPISPDREVAQRKVGAAGGTTASDEPARPEPPTVGGVATSGSSKSEADGGAVPATDEARPAQPDQIADGSIVMHTISDLLRDIGDSSLTSPRDALIDGLEATRGRHIAELLGAIPSSQLPPLGQLSGDSWNLVDETLVVLAGEILSGVYGSLVSHNAGIYEETAESLARRVRDFIVRIWGRFVGEQAPESDYFCFVEQLDITIHEVRHEHVARAWRMHEESYRESAKRIGSVVAPKQTRAVGNAGISADPAPESIHAELGGATDMGEGSGDRTSPGLQLPTRQRPGKEQKGDASLLAGKRAVSFWTAEQYLGITDRQRQYLVKDGKLTVEGKGQNRKITTDSLRICLPPENPN
jgi:hypothetical protein